MTTGSSTANLYGYKKPAQLSFGIRFLKNVPLLLKKLFLLNSLLFVFVATLIASATKAEIPIAKPGQQIIGAELYANVIQPGKISITLQTFYRTSQTDVPGIQIVNLLEGNKKTTAKTIELKKETEFIDVKYPIVESKQFKTLPSVKSIIYTSVIDLNSSDSSYDITWSYWIITEPINNVAINDGEALVLKAHIDDVSISTYNSAPVLGRLPVVQVSSLNQLRGRFDVTDSDQGDLIEVELSEPFVIELSSKSTFRKVDYRKGFSFEIPAGQSFSYNKETKEFVFDSLNMGKYLFAITITDHRNQKVLSQHQAVFIIESIL